MENIYAISFCLSKDSGHGLALAIRWKKPHEDVQSAFRTFFPLGVKILRTNIQVMERLDFEVCVRCNEATAKDIAISLSSGPSGVGEFKIIRTSEIPPSKFDFDSVPCSPIMKNVLKNGKRLANNRYSPFGSINTEVVPFVLEKYIVFGINTTFNFSGLFKNSLNPTKQQYEVKQSYCIIYKGNEYNPVEHAGLEAIEMKTTYHDVEKQFVGKAELGVNTNGMSGGLGIEKSEKTIYRQANQKLKSKKEKGVEYIIATVSKAEISNAPSQISKILILFNLHEPINNLEAQEICLKTDFGYSTGRIKPNTFDTWKLSSTEVTLPGAVNLGIIGFPKCGKTTLLKELTKSIAISKFSSSDTPYVMKDKYNNFKVQNIEKPLVVLDTRGYHFNQGAHDKALLKAFVRGLRAGTEFSKKELPKPEDYDADHALTHMILTISARDLYLPKFTWFWYRTGEFDATPQFQGFIDIYKDLVANMKDARRVHIVITHLDMIPFKERDDFKDNLVKKFREKGIPEEFIVFGERECDWDQNALKKDEDEIGEWIHRLQPDEEWWTKLKAEGKESAFLYYRTPSCLRKSQKCKHCFTKDTLEGYETMILHVLSYCQ